MYEKILLNKYVVPSPNKLEWVRNHRPISQIRKNETNKDSVRKRNTDDQCCLDEIPDEDAYISLPKN